MARPRSKPAETFEPSPETVDIIQANHAAFQQVVMLQSEAAETAQAVAVQFGYQGAVTVEALECEIRHHQRRSVEAVLELGKCLLVLKELTGHGGFIERVETLGFSRQMAHKFMTATVKFANVASTRHLKNIGQTKLLELLVLDDGEIDALERGEDIRGITLDEFETMTVSEMRKALREGKAIREALEKLNADKNAKIDELTTRRIKVLPPDEELAKIRAELAGFLVGVEGALQNKLRPAFRALADHIAVHGGGCDDYLDGALKQIERGLGELREEFGLLGNSVPWKS
jgi:hypothetical protein